MGCNCKQKRQEIKIPEAVVQEIKETRDITLETINEIERQVNSVNSDGEIKLKLETFFRETLGEIIPPYCDQVCKKRLLLKLNNLKQQI